MGIRTLAAAAPESSESSFGRSSGSSTELYLAAIDQPDRLFSYVVPGAAVTPANAAKLLAVPAAGKGTVGSIGDGGAATAAELDLHLDDFTMRSGVAIGPDGTLYIADTGNATIRSVGGAASSEPAIIRSVAGRWAPRQNVELTEPLGVALDRAGNLYIADHGADAVVVLYGPAAAKSGQMETLAHMVSPASVAVTPDGSTVYAASPDTGVIVAINTQTRALRSAGISPAALFGSAASASGARIIPEGLAVDGGGNLFVAYAAAGGTSDQILRLDAFSAKVTVAARGLSAPGDISFDTQGDLFVANQGMRQVLKFASLGVPATGVSLTPPGNCAGASTTYCDQLIGGTSPTAPFELSNNTASAITAVSAAFASGNTSDFTIANTSCASSLSANSSCAYNVAFTPTQNATTACTFGAAANTRCATLAVNYTGATAPLTAEASGVADDFQISCMTTAVFTCPPPTTGAPYQITISQGYAATFQLQIVPDSTFSGTVTLNCPTNLPVAPAGTVGAPTICGISAGTSVSIPLANTLTVPVVAGTAVPFNITFQTTATNGRQFSGIGASRSAGLVGLFASRSGGNDASGGVRTGVAGGSAQRSAVLLVLLAGGLFVLVPIARQKQLRRGATVLAFIFAAVMCATFVGCGGGSGTASVIPYTPTGTYPLTVHGSAQNAARGFTVTLVVD